MKKNRGTQSLEDREYKAIDVIRLSYLVEPMATIAFFVVSIIEAIIPTSLMALSTAHFVDTALSILDGGTSYVNIYFPLSLMILLMGIVSVLGSLNQLVEAKIRGSLERNLLPTIVAIQANLKYCYIEDKNCKELIDITSDELLETFLDGLRAFISVITSVIGIGSVTALIVTKLWWAAVLMVLLSIPILWVSLWAGKRNYEAKVETRKYEHRYSYYSDEVLCSRDAAQERALFEYSDKITDRYYEYFKISSNIELKVLLNTRLVTKATSIAFLIATMLTSLALINPVVHGTISLGLFMGVVAALLGIAKTLGWQLQDATKNIAEAREYMDNLTKLVRMEKATGATDPPDKTPIEFQSLEFKNVRFKYPNSSAYVLNGVSFTIQKGKHYAFVGKNGAGKSTIIKLLIGLYDDYEGEILINGRELRTFHASTLKAMFSVIFQDFSRYQISLLDNIALGNVTQEIDEQYVLQIANNAGLGKVIIELPNGIKTLLGRIHRSGTDISGGQWQKVAIARSFFSTAPIKVLDEPTAALDPLFESQIYNQFKTVMQDRTAILISHRLGATKLSSDIFVLDNGTIVETGCHEDLIKKGGIYAHMYKEQSKWYK